MGQHITTESEFLRRFGALYREASRAGLLRGGYEFTDDGVEHFEVCETTQRELRCLFRKNRKTIVVTTIQRRIEQFTTRDVEALRGKILWLLGKRHETGGELPIEDGA